MSESSLAVDIFATLNKKINILKKVNQIKHPYNQEYLKGAIQTSF